MLPSEIHHQICQVYGDNAMSDGMVRKWVRMFNAGQENLNDEERIGRPSLVNDDLLREVNERVRADRRFTISDLSLHFPQVSRTLLYEIVSSHLGYRKVWLTSQEAVFCEEGIKNLCPATTSASTLAANKWKNSLKNVESDKNKMLYETLLDILQRNDTYFLNKPRIFCIIILKLFQI